MIPSPTLALLTSITVALALVWSSTAGPAPTHDHLQAARTWSSVNDWRDAHRLADVDLDEDLTVYARRHALAMADDGRLRHSDVSQAPGPWRVAGEIVGKGGSIDDIMWAFIDSTDHKGVLLGRAYDEAGIGVAWDGELFWVTAVFADTR